MAETSESPVAGKSGNGSSEEKSGIQSRAQELKERLSTKADSATTRVGQRIESVSHAVRERAPAQGRLQGAAGTVAEKLDRMGAYLKDQDVGAMKDDLTTTIRRHPMRSMLVGVGVGYLLARLVSRKR